MGITLLELQENKESHKVEVIVSSLSAYNHCCDRLTPSFFQATTCVKAAIDIAVERRNRVGRTGCSGNR